MTAPQTTSYKSFCWCLGTTSFRVADLNRRIEQQLMLLDQFWNLDENRGQRWKNNPSLQQRYYDFMKAHGFLSGNARRPDKDARQKISGLSNLGLVDDDRRLTPAGESLLRISYSGDFTSDNLLGIARDSFLYLRQLLKVSLSVNTRNESVRPLPLLIHLLLDPELGGYLSLEEFCYLLPLCINADTTAKMRLNILDLRAGRKNIDSCLLDTILPMDNYRYARKIFIAAPAVTPELIMTVGMNRKSRTEKQNYDLPYYYLYLALERLYMNRDGSAGQEVADALAGLNQSSIKSSWRRTLFGNAKNREIIARPLQATAIDNPLAACGDIAEFRGRFFDLMHLIKTKATLEDYCDQNRRYFSTADILLFNDSKVSLDVVPAQFFASCSAELYALAFTPCGFLREDSSLEEISPALAVSADTLLAGLRSRFNKNFTDIGDAMSEVDRERLARFNSLIDDIFTDNDLTDLLTYFENRDDRLIQRHITDNATVPTLFEYVLGIIWYKLSGRRGNILEYMKLSLDANLLPRSHAAGGGADIVYEYADTAAFPAHNMLLEATLSEKTSQRKMEMEPVSRHLGDELIKTHNDKSYCVFVTDELDPNVISDFRGRRNHTYYDRTGSGEKVTSMKIIPLDIADIKNIIAQAIGYEQLYDMFDQAYRSGEFDDDPVEWYNHSVRSRLKIC